MDAVLSKMSTVDEGTKAATRLGELAAELDAQLTRVGARLQFIEKLESRVNNLHVLTQDNDRKLAEQLARRNEVESLKSLCDTLGTQVVDVQQKLDGVAAHADEAGADHHAGRDPGRSRSRSRRRSRSPSSRTRRSFTIRPPA